jgi:hypothetical protein
MRPARHAAFASSHEAKPDLMKPWVVPVSGER